MNCRCIISVLYLLRLANITCLFNPLIFLTVVWSTVYHHTLNIKTAVLMFASCFNIDQPALAVTLKLITYKYLLVIRVSSVYTVYSLTYSITETQSS